MSKEREKEIDNAPLIFSDYAAEQREKRYYAIQYCKLGIQALVSFVAGILLCFLLKLLQP